MNGGNETKYYIDASDYAQLRARLHTVAKPDENANENGVYKVRSLYFDNCFDKAIIDKFSGQSKREKFRLRYYNDDTSLIKLEKKIMTNRLTFKGTTTLTKEQCSSLLSGGYDGLNATGKPVLMELYVKMRCQTQRPRSIVEFWREAYNFSAGNVRISFDSEIKTSKATTGFLDAKLVTIPVSDEIIMEIKYDGFLPDIIRDLLQIGGREQTGFSKHIVSRLA